MKCSMLCGALVSGLRAGGTSDRITIVAAKLQAAIRAALEPCDPVMGETVVGMLSDVQSKPNIKSGKYDFCADARSDSAAEGSIWRIDCSMNCLPAGEAAL
jgi:hypothetical protein